MEKAIGHPTNGASGRRRIRIIIPAYPAINIYSHYARVTTALGPVSVATAVNEVEGWDVEVIDENNYRRSAPRDASGLPDHEALQELRPAHVVGFYGGLTSTIPRLYEVARFYRERGILTIAGGQHFVGDNITEALTHHVDIVVIGEGEETLKELLLAFGKRHLWEDIAGIAYLDQGQPTRTRERSPLTDFDHLPIPEFSLVRYAQIELYPVGRVRGCGMDCEFCTVKGKARYAQPERLIEQVATLFETRGAKWFFIVDDLFGQDRLETLRLCRLLEEYQQKINTRFKITVQIRLDKAKDAELLQAMRRAGIATVAIGFESPIGEELRAMDKRLKPEEMIALARRYHYGGFWVHGMFIFGYPLPEGAIFKMPARERIRHFRRFIRKAKIDTVQVLLPVPLPGTELTHRLKQQNRIYSQEYLGWEYYDGNFPLFVPDEPMSPEEMQASMHKIMGRFYQFKHMFHIGLNILSFPVLFFYLHNLKKGWWRWYRTWTNNVSRFGGWVLMRRWFAEFKKSKFPGKLAEAQRILAQHLPVADKTWLPESSRTSMERY
jgi:radical SAM superfamily enzyme YgiQ (UPF0313 family)